MGRASRLRASHERFFANMDLGQNRLLFTSFMNNIANTTWIWAKIVFYLPHLWTASKLEHGFGPKSSFVKNHSWEARRREAGGFLRSHGKWTFELLNSFNSKNIVFYRKSSFLELNMKMANYHVVFMNNTKTRTWIRVKIVLWKHMLEKVTAFLGKLFRNSNEFPSPPPMSYWI